MYIRFYEELKRIDELVFDTYNNMTFVKYNIYYISVCGTIIA